MANGSDATLAPKDDTAAYELSANEHTEPSGEHTASEPDELIIRPGRRTRRYWHEVWSFRPLLWQLARRDLSSRYKQTALGLAWTIVHPVISMIVLTVVFGRLAKMPAEGDVPYPLLVFSGLLGWQIFASGSRHASGALVRNKSLIKKLYFPRILLLLQVQLVILVDFLVALAVFALIMAAYGVLPDGRLLALPLFVVLAMSTSFGLGLWLAALNVSYRDLTHLVPYLVQIGMFLSPVGFSSVVVPERWILLYSLNPMVGVLDGFRWSLLGGQTTLYLPGLAVSTTGALVLVVSGIVFFRRREGTLADFL
ncbi:MAG: ABC transporter permease [Thermoanaerobaculia bacterium]|nr:ABC transporter permease [Thermoanaerobaculia bacterium]